ncbi:MAG: phosphotransferase [Oscillospiraceae bacterium]|nr:phosphotransferase [Oscillospiraceae bacterium]
MADFNENMPLTIALSGRIDSLNAEKTETEIRQILNGSAPETLIIDAKDLVYLSSAGLRIILRLKKSCSGLKIIHVNPEVYDILEMTGFTEMLQVEKAYRVISVENCEVIGEGFNGIVYKIDRETIVKVYKNDDPLSAIQHEREVARLALILGVPTAISYDVVQVGSSYGSVFELLNARSFSRILAEEPEKMDWCVREYTELLRTIHGIQVPEGKLPSMKEENRKNILRVKSYLPAELGEKLVRMAEQIPESDHMIHGDYHTKNVVLAGQEVLIIDMDTLSVGHPIFELAQMYNSFVGFSEFNPEVIRSFQGIEPELARKFWKRSLAAYLQTEDPERIQCVEEKVRCLAYAELIDWTYRHPPVDPEEKEKSIALWMRELTGLLEKLDSLTF